MDDGKYNDWFNKYFDDNAVAFAEKMDDDFNDFCLQRFIEKDVDIERD